MRSLCLTLGALLIEALALVSPARPHAQTPSERVPGVGGPAARVIALFPSDSLTVADPTQLTGRRVALRFPNCAADPSGCDEVRLLNQLDGFSVNPRLSLRVSASLDLDSLTRASAFVLPLAGGDPVALTRLAWGPEGRTLYANPERLLSQGSRYALVLTRAVKDARGRPLTPSPEALRLSRDAVPRQRGPEADARPGLLKRLTLLGIRASEVAAFSIFTTQSVTADLEKIRRQLDQLHAPRLRFALASGESRSIFPRGEIARIDHLRQVGVANGSRYAPPVTLPLALIPASEVGVLAFGAFRAPSYLTPKRVFVRVPSRTGEPRVQREEEIHLTLLLPAKPKPPRGWPVAVFGHGYGGDRHGATFAVAASMARHGFATLAINVVGHGGGDRGVLVIERPGREALVLPSGGRGVDLDGDGEIGTTEGVGTLSRGPLTLISNRDGIRQTVADLMGLFRALRAGVDVDGDGQPDLDGDRLYYFGQSLGGIYGTLLLAVDPLVTVGVLNVPGGPIVEVARLSSAFRGLVMRALKDRTPPLLNGVEDFYESLPLAGEPPVRTPRPGAIAIQEYLARAEWVGHAGNPVAYAPHLKLAPLQGNGPKAVLYQLAVGDRTVPNLTTLHILRAGALFPSASAYRHDRIVDQLGEYLQDPHGFLTWTSIPEVSGIARAAQDQVARFFLSRGARIEHPDLFNPRPYSVPVFEVPFRP